MGEIKLTAKDHVVAVVALLALSVAFHGMIGAVGTLGSGQSNWAEHSMSVPAIVRATDFGSIPAPDHVNWGRAVMGVSGLR